jgi:hypothetical protein
VKILPDGTYLAVLIKPTIRGGRRERLLAAARGGEDLDDINAVPDAFDNRGLPLADLAGVVECDVPDREGNGSGELIVLLTTILDPQRPGPTNSPASTTSGGSRRGVLPGRARCPGGRIRELALTGTTVSPLVHPAGRGKCWFRGSLVEEPQQLVVHRLVMA